MPFPAAGKTDSRLTETAIRVTSRALIVQRNVARVSSTGRYTVTVAIAAYYSDDVTIENL